MIEETPTAAEIAQHYSASLDSVTLINDLMALGSRDDEQTASVARNVEHLELMVAKTYWTTEDLAPLNAAITAGKA
tara:strand:- start:1806 stop:2033 length:228 start_codon:yes stop_codon:yes gene_type:complete